VKYKITYYDPMRWVDEVYVVYAETKLKAKEIAKEAICNYPPLYHSSYIKIEKVKLVEMLLLNE
jgi:hypothetical protein